MSELTGDTLLDTYNALCEQRLAMLRSGPQVNYSIHGHKVDKMSYMKYLDEAIFNAKRELAARDPVEEIGFAF